MNKEIVKLTKEQKKQIPVFIDKFVKQAQKKTDRKAATKATQDLYKSIGEEKPIIIYAKSPFAAVVMVAMCKILFKDKLPEKNSQLRRQLYSQLYRQLYSQLYRQLYR